MISIKKRDVLDELILYFCFFEILFLNWILTGRDTIIALVCLLMLIRIIYYFPSILKNNPKSKFILWGIVSMIVYIIINTIANGTFKYFGENMFKLFKSYIVVLYFMFLLIVKYDLVKKVFEKMYYLLNAYYLLNFYILFKQLNNSYFLIDMQKTSNSMYEDQITGFIGVDGTHRLTLFSIFIIILNLYMIYQNKVKYKKLTYIYILITTILMLYLSRFNDNNAIYVLLPLIFIFYILINVKINYKSCIKVIIVIVAILTILIILINSGKINLLLPERVISITNKFLAIFSGGEIKEERMEYVRYALENLNGYYFGRGFGAIRIYKDPSIPNIYSLRNWGMSNISSLISMGGVIFYVLWVYLYSKTFGIIVKNNQVTRIIFILMLLLSYYQQVMTEVPLTILLCFILVIFILKCKEKNKNN